MLGHRASERERALPARLRSLLDVKPIQTARKTHWASILLKGGLGRTRSMKRLLASHAMAISFWGLGMPMASCGTATSMTFAMAHFWRMAPTLTFRRRLSRTSWDALALLPHRIKKLRVRTGAARPLLTRLPLAPTLAVVVDPRTPEAVLSRQAQTQHLATWNIPLMVKRRKLKS
jgi:hypothetical protein